MSSHLRTPEQTDLSGMALGLIACLIISLIVLSYVAGLRPDLPPPPLSRNTAQNSCVSQGNPMPSAPEPQPIIAGVDATRSEPADLDALRQTLENLSLPPSPAFGIASATGLQTEEDGVDWFIWSRLGSRRAVLSSGVPFPQSFGIYAVQSSEGATVCLVNRLATRQRVTLRTRLPRGVFRIDRLNFTPVKDSSSVFPICQLRRLEGVDLAQTGVVEKLLFLEPGQVCLVRFTDEARAARAAYYAALQNLNKLAQNAPTPARRMRNMLKEGEPYLSGLAGTKSMTLKRRVGCVQRLRLNAAQAQAFLQNNLDRKAIRGAAAVNLMGALEQHTDALSETGATLLGLVPQIDVAGGPAPESAPSSSGPRARDSVALTSVTVAVQNAGEQNIEMVKVGLEPTALPQGIRIEPVDDVYFGTLRRGQKVKAVFQLRGEAVTRLPASAIVGDIAYFASGLLAHLRVRAW